ncbi:phytoene/squalene synthase family protein [Saliterribacillus persicus]|uniref:Phytoene synthase n=1 Tax=Saliterribacillus persicus TaxID=930114 RepID=A0A368Y1G1_9BACI|nr:phytoene/squalene synthase family protein [Saliterribacillus persicus]RCW73138.1 phytoene synthase [Saliterribacillus persicus]
MLNQAFQTACKNMMKEGSSSFYQAFKYLPSPRREAVYIIYSFCRMIDDSVDEPEKSPYTLEELEDNFNALEKAEGHFIWPALRYLFNHFTISKEPFYTQIRGQRMDFVKHSYDTFEELEDYCYHVAGSVGEMLLPVLHDAPTTKVTNAGIALGKGMQIVNIIRDVGTDKRLGRRYIPKELMDKHNYSMEEFNRNVINDSFMHMIDELMDQADKWFDDGLKGLETYPKESAFSIKLAAGYYHEILKVVKENNYEVYRKRAIVTARRKGKLFLETTN